MLSGWADYQEYTGGHGQCALGSIPLLLMG